MSPEQYRRDALHDRALWDEATEQERLALLESWDDPEGGLEEPSIVPEPPEAEFPGVPPAERPWYARWPRWKWRS